MTLILMRGLGEAFVALRRAARRHPGVEAQLAK